MGLTFFIHLYFICNAQKVTLLSYKNLNFSVLEYFLLFWLTKLKCMLEFWGSSQEILKMTENKLSRLSQYEIFCPFLKENRANQERCLFLVTFFIEFLQDMIDSVANNLNLKQHENRNSNRNRKKESHLLRA